MNISKENTSYPDILKSTTLVGGSQVINIFLGILRNKVLAVLLGPSGIGLIGLYQAITSFASTATGFGIGLSGVRQIAESVGTGDKGKIALTIKTLRRISLALGFFGMLFTAALSLPISKLTFGNNNHVWAIAILSVTLLFGAVSGGQVALVQGMRRIADLARISVLGALLGTMISIPMVFLWREKGIVPFLITVSAMTILISWWYARKIPVDRIVLGWSETFREAKSLLSLGIVFMASGIMASGIMYFIRFLVLRKIGLEAVGLYQAAFTLSSIYIGVIISAMSMDFYPRLTAAANDDKELNRLVNEQTEVGLLMAVPGILATLTFAPLIINIFYSSSFVPAYEVLRWQILGIFLRVISWPMGFMLLAKGKGRVFLGTEFSASMLHVILIWSGISFLGLVGTGIAFFVLYIFYTGMMFTVVRYIFKFSWSKVNVRLMLLASAFLASAFLIQEFISKDISLVSGIIITLVGTSYCFLLLYKIVGKEWFLAFKSKIKLHCIGK